MATIRSQLSLNDGMSTVLRRISTALSATLDSFEQVQRASGQAIDTQSIQRGRAALAEANDSIQQMEEYYRRAAQAEERLNQNIRSGTSAADSMLSKVKSMALTIGGAMGAQKVLGLSDQLASGSARLSLIVDDGESVDALEEKIMASAQRSRAGYLDTLQTVSKLGLTAGDAFTGNDELLRFTELVNKNFVVGGASAAEQESAMYQLTQAMSSGRLQGDEYKSIIENAPLLAGAIEDYMRNVQGAQGSMKDWASEGLLTADVIKNALFSSADEVEERFAEIPMTWDQIWTNIGNRALAAFKPVLMELNQVANSSQFEQAIGGATTALATMGAVAAAVFGVMVSLASGVVDNWSILEPVIMGVAAAVLLYNGYLAVSSGLKMLDNLQTGIAAVLAYKAAAANTALAEAERDEAMSAASAAAAQHGLNAALLASPVTWVLVAIIAVIAALYATVAAINKVTGSSLSATGIICGAVAVAGAFIGNLAIGLLNALIQNIWTRFVEPFLGIIEWVLNVCNGGFDSFGGAVANLIGQIISWFLSLGKVVTTIIDAIFSTDWTSGLSALQDSVTDWGKNDSAITLEREAPLIDHRFEYGDAWAAGNDFGKGIDDKIGGMFDFDLGAAENYGSSSFALDDIAANTGAIAGNTGNMADALSVSTEELAYLRDIAERDAINRFTTAEVKIDMTGMNNRIEGSADLDGVLSTLTDGFAEALLTAAEGVHT